MDHNERTASGRTVTDCQTSLIRHDKVVEVGFRGSIKSQLWQLWHFPAARCSKPREVRTYIHHFPFPREAFVRLPREMFRRNKKNVGVTVLEEDGDTGGGPDANREALFAGANVAGASSRSPLSAREHVQGVKQLAQRLTVKQLEAQALREARVGKESTARALRLATEARETGVQTAAQLSAQTKQLEKMGDDIEVVHDYLDKSERTINKMTKPKIVRMFQYRKKDGKGLNKVKASKKERNARDELREAGVNALDVDRMQAGEGAITRVSNDTEEEKKRSLFGKNKSEGRKGVREIENDYSQYTSEVAKVHREQDKDLDQISDLLTDMQALGNAMHSEIQLQDTLLEEGKNFTEETRKRTQANAKKLAGDFGTSKGGKSVMPSMPTVQGVLFSALKK